MFGVNDSLPGEEGTLTKHSLNEKYEMRAKSCDSSTERSADCYGF